MGLASVDGLSLHAHMRKMGDDGLMLGSRRETSTRRASRPRSGCSTTSAWRWASRERQARSCVPCKHRWDPSCCMASMDDVFVYFRTEEQHYEDLEAVLKRLITAGWKIKAAKSNFMAEKFVFLGHVDALSRAPLASEHGPTSRYTALWATVLERDVAAVLRTRKLLSTAHEHSATVKVERVFGSLWNLLAKIGLRLDQKDWDLKIPSARAAINFSPGPTGLDPITPLDAAFSPRLGFSPAALRWEADIEFFRSAQKMLVKEVTLRIRGERALSLTLRSGSSFEVGDRVMLKHPPPASEKGEEGVRVSVYPKLQPDIAPSLTAAPPPPRPGLRITHG